MADLLDKLVFITGGDSGIGLATARLMAARGAHIAIFSRAPRDESLDLIKAARQHDEQRTARYAVDVADPDGVNATMQRASAELGLPDIVICNAGIGGVERFVDSALAQFDRMMQVNVYGTRHVLASLLPDMLARGSGRVVLVGSLGGLLPVYGYTSYGTSKFAISGLAQCLRYELAPLGIQVSWFAPGQVDTPGLASEAEALLPEAAILKRIGGTITPSAAAAALVQGIERGRFLIIPGLRSRVTYWMYRLTPLPLWNWFTDRLIGLVATDRGPSVRPR